MPSTPTSPNNLAVPLAFYLMRSRALSLISLVNGSIKPVSIWGFGTGPRGLTTKSNTTGPPTAPQPEECCNSGCENCCMDEYFEEMEKYRGRINTTLATAATVAAGSSAEAEGQKSE